MITTKYQGPTDNKGSFILVRDSKSRRSMRVPYDYAARHPHDIAAAKFAEKLGITPTDLVVVGYPRHQSGFIYSTRTSASDVLHIALDLKTN